MQALVQCKEKFGPGGLTVMLGDCGNPKFMGLQISLDTGSTPVPGPNKNDL